MQSVRFGIFGFAYKSALKADNQQYNYKCSNTCPLWNLELSKGFVSLVFFLLELIFKLCALCTGILQIINTQEVHVV